MKIDSTQLKFILENTPAAQNIMLVGKHGIGKSRILEDFFAARGEKVVTLFLGQMSDPGDLIGLPHLDEKTGRTDFMLPYWFPVDSQPIVLFLDELNRARPEVLQTVMDLTLNRKLAGKCLPAGSRIISAVNGGSEYQLTELDPALVSRFNIYEFAPSVEDWINWARGAGLDSRIIDFISENPEYLDGDSSLDDSDGLSRSPDRRSWERTSNIIKNFKSLGQKELVLVSGIVGSQAASLFFRFVNDSSLPSAKSILCFEDGETCLVKKLSELSVPQLCLVSESLFRFIEGGSNSESPADTFLISKNLNAYYDFLLDSSKEAAAHFISLCSVEKYPAVLNFINEHCQPLYKKILQTISDL